MAPKNHPRLEKYGSGPPDQRVVVFMESLSFNWRLYQYDIQDAWGMFAEPMLELASKDQRHNRLQPDRVSKGRRCGSRS
jgi:hypothetical protein